MKFLSFRAGRAAQYGVADGNNVIDLTRRLKYPDLKSLIAADARAELQEREQCLFAAETYRLLGDHEFRQDHLCRSQLA